MAMIESLTKAEIEAQRKYRRKGMEMGLSTEPADRKKAEKAIIGLYALDKRPAPEFFWVDSPFAAQKLIAEKRGIKLSYDSNFFSGQHDAGYVAWVQYYRDVIAKNHKELKFDKKALEGFKHYEAVTESCNWWWPMEGACVVSERPKVCKVDDSGQIHNDEGPCWEFRDNFKAFAIHGIIVPEKVVMNPKSLTIDEINGETNQEVSRIMIDRFGALEYFEKTGAELVSQDKIDIDGTTSRALFKDSKGNKWMLCSDGSTPRPWCLPMPRNANSCKEGHSAICGFDENLLVAEA